MDDIPKDILEAMEKMIQDAEICKGCGKEGDEEAFICVICESWYCADCESKEEFVCKPCHLRSSFRIVREK